MTRLSDLADECGTDKGAHQGYMKHYQAYLPYWSDPITLVELGVYRGHSLVLWRKHFNNPQSNIIGVDIDLSQMDNVPYPTGIRVVEGDQADPGIAATVGSMTPVDILIDDASHEGPKTSESFEVWWPQVRKGGLYVVEDTHCSYNTDHYASAGKPGTPYTMMEFLKMLADDVNWGIHGYDRFTPMFKDVAYVHFYPGIVFIGKKG